MLRRYALIQLKRIALVPFAVCFASGCGGDETVGSNDGSPGDSGVESGSATSIVSDAGDAAPRDSSPGATVVSDAGDVGRQGPAPVNLGSTTDLTSAAAYVLLAKTGITNVTGSLISGGNVGLSPATSAAITGFALIPPSPPTVSATSVSVMLPGLVYAGDFTAPTPANLTAAVLSMQGAYTDAAGRTLPDHLNLASGNLGGLVLTPGLYSWGTTVSIPANVTISGGANDTWIFQISNDLDLSTATSVLLAGGAQAKNIVWQVAGQATLHANSHFEGIILSQTAITLQTMASMRGRCFAQSLIALDNNAVTAP
ncbi:MAG: ice-binding family protein [Myxococcota bacterium]|nr:ice-binding family protein [Myxococcota bacterium]